MFIQNTFQDLFWEFLHILVIMPKGNQLWNKMLSFISKQKNCGAENLESRALHQSPPGLKVMGWNRPMPILALWAWQAVWENPALGDVDAAGTINQSLACPCQAVPCVMKRGSARMSHMFTALSQQHQLVHVGTQLNAKNTSLTTCTTHVSSHDIQHRTRECSKPTLLNPAELEKWGSSP